MARVRLAQMVLATKRVMEAMARLLIAFTHRQLALALADFMLVAVGVAVNIQTKERAVRVAADRVAMIMRPQ